MSEQGRNECFVCGVDNADGMRLTFDLDHVQRKVMGRFRIPTRYQGAHGWVHGGVIATLLDEAMGKANRFSDVRAVTAEIQIEYLRPVLVEEEIIVTGYPIGRNGRVLRNEAVIVRLGGEVLARGRGKFVVVDPEKLVSRKSA